MKLTTESFTDNTENTVLSSGPELLELLYLWWVPQLHLGLRVTEHQKYASLEFVVNKSTFLSIVIVLLLRYD